MRTRSGLSTEAVFIFHNMVRKLLDSFKPDYIAAIFESSEPTVRSQAFTDYKANRTEMPPDLGPQIGYIRRLLEAMHIPLLEFQGYEADDVIATMATRLCKEDYEIFLVSKDKDLRQVLTDCTKLYDPHNDEVMDPAALMAKLGYTPDPPAAP